MSPLVWLAVVGTARAESFSLELLRPDGKSFAVHEGERVVDGQQIVIPDGERAWSVTLDRHSYEERLRVCAELSAWRPDGEQEVVGRTCVTLTGKESPEATVFHQTDDVHIRLTVKR